MNLRINPIINLSVYVWRYSFNRKKNVVIYVALFIIANCIFLLEPLIIGRIFNSIQFNSDDPELLGFLIRNLSLLIATTVGFWMFHGTGRVIENSNAFLVRKNYKQTMFDRVLALPIEWHKDHHSGDTIDKINKASDHLHDFSAGAFRIIESGSRFIGAIIVLSIYDWRASAISIFATIVSFTTIWFFDRVIRRRYQKIFAAENFLASGLHDYVTNIFTIITLRSQKRASKEVDRRGLRAYPLVLTNQKTIEAKWFTTSLFVTMMTVTILITNAYFSLKIDGVIMIGSLFILYRYLSSIGGAFYTFAWIYGDIVRGDAAMRAADVINTAYRRQSKGEIYTLPSGWRALQIKNIEFSYKNQQNNNGKGNIRGADIRIKRGQRIAIIGESGSGKSTIFSLIRGLHDVDTAVVYCDGKRLPGGIKHLYEHVTLIPQEPEIFNSTIGDNISMGIPASQNRIKKVVDIARFKDVIDKLPKGLQTNVLEKGVSLSGGEKQRLALARGLLAAEKSDFLLLDEPTSSVDNENEQKIYESIFKHYQDKTILSAIHRLHLLPQFDYIYMFQDGKIISEGTFHTLLKDKYFSKIWKKYTEQNKQ